MIELHIQIQTLLEKLEGATAINVFLLNKLGGQITIAKDELHRVLSDFQTMHYSVSGDQICIKLVSGPPEVHGREAA